MCTDTAGDTAATWAACYEGLWTLHHTLRPRRERSSTSTLRLIPGAARNR
jgi:hypothetical protein